MRVLSNDLQKYESQKTCINVIQYLELLYISTLLQALFHFSVPAGGLVADFLHRYLLIQ